MLHDDDNDVDDDDDDDVGLPSKRQSSAAGRIDNASLFYTTTP